MGFFFFSLTLSKSLSILAFAQEKIGFGSIKFLGASGALEAEIIGKPLPVSSNVFLLYLQTIQAMFDLYL